MNYSEAIDWIHGRLKFGIKPGIERMKWFMDKLEHPEDKITAIHIAGTNGKGSTLSFLRSILQAHGYTVGTFTSPYIVTFNERISINGEPIDNQSWVNLVEKIKPLSEELGNTALESPTEFEVITAMAFDYFANNPVDFVLFETGLGGMYDSTNVVKPVSTVITTIGKDHVAILGDSLEEIAIQKAGIIKEHVPVFSAVTQPECQKVISQVAKENHAPVLFHNDDFHSNVKVIDGEESVSIYTPLMNLENITLGLKGLHQAENAALATMAFLSLARQFEIRPTSARIKEGLFETKWPGRFEEINHKPKVIIDGAHNEEGMKALIKTLTTNESKKHLIFSALSDKPVGPMLSQLSEVFGTVTFTSFDFPRASSAEDLFNQSKHQQKYKINDWKEAIKDRLEAMNESDTLVITGSLYFISLVREYFGELEKM